MSINSSIYVLGVSLSRPGSACLLKDGKICVAIEKERITRIKNDGFNDSASINYCLETAGISMDDIRLVVQNVPIGMFAYGNEFFHGDRPFKNYPHIPVTTISHHLAHAYAGIGLSPFEKAAVFILDGNGNLYEECLDLEGATIAEKIAKDLRNVYLEKDSFYLFDESRLHPIYKDFSPVGYLAHPEYALHPDIKHSMGSLYHAVTGFCGLGEDPGKLMGLAPYGREELNIEMLKLENGRNFINYDWQHKFNRPARTYIELKNNFQYYANLARLAQKELERGILYLLRHRRSLLSTSVENLIYVGGVALNAVTNYKILKSSGFKHIFIPPAAGDNGISIGCAYYGWLEVLKRERVPQDGNSCFGKIYNKETILKALTSRLDDAPIFKKQAAEAILKAFPHSLFKEKLIRKQFRLQIVLSDVGIYSLLFNYETVRLVNGPTADPECIIYLESETLLKIHDDASNFGRALRQGKIRMEGSGEYILQTFDFLKLKSQVNKGSIAKEKDLLHLESEDYTRLTARLLSLGKIVGWFQDGSEFGPRALGHRSILADPRRPDVQQFINATVKFREDFRPFAPSVLLEDASEYFEFNGESPYMLMIAPVKRNWVERIRGVVHVDHTARLQTVSGDWNAKFRELLTAFKGITGISILLNTSFNTAGMPIVETPEEAIAVFFETAMDVLVLDNVLVFKNKADLDLVWSWTQHVKVSTLPA